MPTEPTRDLGQGPRSPRWGTVVRAVVVGAAMAQLAVAIVLAVEQGTTPPQDRQVTSLVPAGAVAAEETTTSTTLPPVVVVEGPATTGPVPSTAAVPTGAVYGVIGAGPGGQGRADLRDEAGNTWHSEASSRGEYRFDRLPPGRYQLILSAESGSASCAPDGTCVGTALAISKRIVEIEPGQEIRQDYPVYGPTAPGPPAVATTTTSLPEVPIATTTTTTSTPAL